MSKPNRVTFNNIADRAELLKDLLGYDLFNKLIGGYDGTAAMAKGVPNYFRRRAAAHPFALAWHDLMEGAVRSKVAGSMQLSEQAIFLVDMYVNLRIAQHDEHFRDLLARLVGRNQFFSTLFEAFIFGVYDALIGMPVALVAESPSTGERRPDLVSVLGNGKKVFLECKSLQDDVYLEDRIWSDIEIGIAKKLEAARGSYHLRIVAARQLEHTDAKSLIDTASDLIENYPLLPSARIQDCDLEIRELLREPDTIALPAHIPFDDDYRTMTGANFDSSSIHKLWLLETKPFPDPDQNKRLANLFKDAARQLPVDAPGVVHLQVPYRASGHFLDVVDAARPQLEEKLTRQPHVCVIVVTGRFLNKQMIAGCDPIVTFHTVIPNFSSKYRLPAGFSLLGSHDIATQRQRTDEFDVSALPGGVFDVHAEGAVFLEFYIDRPLADQEGRCLIQYCSPDGRRQLSAWQTYRNRFRFEVVHEALGRLTLAADLNHLAVGVAHKMLFGWNRDGIVCCVDGGEILR